MQLSEPSHLSPPTAVQPVPQGNVQVVPGSSRPQVLASKASSGASGSGQPTSSNYYSTMLSNASSAISSSGKSLPYTQLHSRNNMKSVIILNLNKSKHREKAPVSDQYLMSEQPPNFYPALQFQSSVSSSNNPTLTLLFTVFVHEFGCLMMMLTHWALHHINMWSDTIIL